MRLLRPVLLVVVSMLLLAGCSGGPPVRVFPPQVTVQELRMKADGEWTADLRIRNYSTVPMHFSRLEATLEIGGREATRIELDPGLAVGPGSIELVPHRFVPSAEARAGVVAAVGAGRGVRYRISGTIRSSEPESDDTFEYESALDPVPGVDGVLR